MPQLLISVRCAAEAERALLGGADWIDVKEPKGGALGPACRERIREVAAVLPPPTPLSVALGELVDRDDQAPIALPRGVAYAKVGLAGCRTLRCWGDLWGRTLSLLPVGVAPVAVAYADWRSCGAPPPADVLRQGVDLGCEYLLIDTFDKALGHLLKQASLAELRRWRAAALELGIPVALAGSLTCEMLDVVLDLAPDVIAIRSAACVGGRLGRICPQLVSRLADRCHAGLLI